MAKVEKHLDLYAKVGRQEQRRLLSEKLGLQVPENLVLSFDFENQVAIIKN